MNSLSVVQMGSSEIIAAAYSADGYLSEKTV